MKVHEGHNVKRFREMRRMKQEALAFDLGEDWSQKKISLLEQKESIDPAVLQQISKVLEVPVEYFQEMDDEQAVNIFGNTVTTVNDNATGQIFQINPVINTAEKWLETLEENKKLYERLLASEREKVELLKAMMGKMK